MAKQNVYIRDMDQDAWKKLRIMAIEEGITVAEKLKQLVEKAEKEKK